MQNLDFVIALHCSTMLKTSVVEQRQLKLGQYAEIVIRWKLESNVHVLIWNNHSPSFYGYPQG